METIAVVKSCKTQTFKLKPPSASRMVNVVFDDTGFELSEYVVEVNDMLRFQNKASMESITIYVLGTDGETASTALLGSYSEINVASGTTVSMVAQGSGTYLLSLEPILVGAEEPDQIYTDLGGTTSEIVLGN